MLEIVDTTPDVSVQTAEYARLLGYPPGWILRDRARELADWAREWYGRNGRPWLYARQANAIEASNGSIRIEDATFMSVRLLATLQRAGAHSAVLVAASAGPEIEQAAQALWHEEKPDEYFFLEVYASAVVEHLVTMTGARLCAWAEQERMAVLPHYSPGYPEWPIDDQSRLLALVKRQGGRLPGALDALDSGMLRPKKSLLAVFGLTHHVDRVRPLSDLVPCDNCSYRPCQYRRSPYRRAQPLDRDAKYTVNVKALARWSRERLSLARQPDDTVRASFHYDGTTCTNMGRPLAFEYRVVLGPRADGYPIREQGCRAADGDVGHQSMCRYLTHGSQLLTEIAGEQPLHGRPLDAVLAWRRSENPAGCYCEPEAREHKWGLVLETIHYALSREQE